MQENSCSVPGCNCPANKRCPSCSSVYCTEHFDDGHPYLLASSDYLCDVAFCGLCHECWIKEVSHVSGLLLLLIIGISPWFLVAFNLLTP
jgi:hypothetical protein